METFVSGTYISSYKGLLLLSLLIVSYHLVTRLITDAQHRRAKIENGCLDPYHFPHRGILGKLLGLDVIWQLVKTGREGRTLEAARLRNYSTGHNTVQIRILRNKGSYVHEDGGVLATIEPQNIQTMLSTSFNDWSLGQRRREVFVPIFGEGIFTRDGAEWQHSRALIRPNFKHQRVYDLNMLETHFQRLFILVSNVGGSPVDLQELFFRLTMDISTEFLFGKSTDTLIPEMETGLARDFVKGFTYATSTVSVALQSGKLLDFIPNHTYRKSVKAINKFADVILVESMAKAHSENEAQGYTFLQELMKTTHDHRTLRSELLNLLMAGRDTTAGLLANTWYKLARHANIWAKLKAEVSAVVGQERLNAAHIRDMKYLRAVLNEMMRLMPPVPMNSRQAVRDTVLPLGGGPDGLSPVFVPKGRVVTYATYSMHRRKDLYGEDALEFKPERWIDGTLKQKPGWEYLPFNGGPRVCIGQDFGLLLVSYITARLVQEISCVEPRDDRDWTEALTLSLSSGVGCWVSLKA